MKSKMVKILETVLRLMAKTVLKKYKPTIVGITGSVGKTSTKEAVYLVLAGKVPVRKNEKNYNNEIGIPLTIIGCESGKRSLAKWIKVFFQWMKLVIFRQDYPEVLVLEMGVDAPGDMKYLTSFIWPKIGIITNISSSHLEYFRDLDHIAKEKGALVEKLLKDGFVILNSDDERVAKMDVRTQAEVVKYGSNESAQVRSSDINFVFTSDGLPAGLSFKLNYEGKSVPVRLHNIVAEHQVQAALAAVAVGIIFKINLVEIAKSLEEYYSPAGRMNLLPGVKNSMVIDDTYNASPASTMAALEVLENIKSSWKVVALGDMLELGSDESDGHKRVLEKMADIKPREVFLVGKRMRKAYSELDLANKLTCSIFLFDDPDVAAENIREKISPGDLILVKGSQGMRMEKITGAIVADPEQAKIHMCRQTEDWKKKPFSNP
jgi:UDP-N-acetylmuramoyl-tripeptide--D-alanyl-D-alanine ligase